MEYRVVEIMPDYTRNWCCRVSKVSGDRVEKDTEPSALGYYYYDGSKLTDIEAFEKLKAYMLKEHNDRIGRLQRSADKLCLCTLQSMP